MIFLSYNSSTVGSTFLGIDVFTLPCTPTNIDHITNVELTNAAFDELYATSNIEDEGVETNQIPDSWNFDTLMLAHFNYDHSAGNVNWHLKDLSNILIKVKPQDESTWIVSHAKKIETYDDLVIIGKFLAAMTGVWNVALVPIMTGTDEGTYVKLAVNVDVNRLVLLDMDNIHSTFLVDSAISTQSVMPSAAVNTIHNKFPYIVRNTRANYETVSVTCTFLPNDVSCLNSETEIKSLAKWNRELKAWIMNGKTKILKSPDGDMWLGYITTPVSDEPYDDGVQELRKLSFGLTETGLPNVTKDLYEARLLDVSVTDEWT